MTAFYFCAATFPLALYFMALALMQARSNFLVVDGKRDFLGLAFATSGLFFIGPGQLMAPWGACEIWGAYVWALVALLYFLVASIVGAVSRTRLIVYNVSRSTLRSALTLASLNLDADARWEGDSLNLPSLDAQFYVDERGTGRVAALVAVKMGSAATIWTDLARELRTRLKGTTSKSRIWILWLVVGVSLLAADGACCRWRCDELKEAVAFYLSL